MRKALLAAVCLLSFRTGFAQDGTWMSTGPEPGFPPDARSEALFRQDAGTYKRDGAYEPGAWQAISERDVRWSKRVWRELSVTDGANAELATVSGGRGLFMTLFEGAVQGQYKAYSNKDERFSQTLSPEQLRALLQPAEGRPPLDPASVTSFRIKEEWIYVASTHRLEGRIIGIAPVVRTRAQTGELVEQTIFWIYYPEARPYFAAQQLADAAGTMTDNLDKLLEEHRFTAPVLETKVGKRETTAEEPPAIIRRTAGQ